MMRYVLDTNVVSELMRPAPPAAVETWVSGQPAAGMFLSALTEAELRYGLGFRRSHSALRQRSGSRLRVDCHSPTSLRPPDLPS